MDSTDARPPTSLEQRLVDELLRERRRDRRWKIVRFVVLFLTFAGIVAYLGIAGRSTDEATAGTGERYVALVRMEGTIAPAEGLSAARFNPVLAEAFADAAAAGIVVVINSPGGTPVQASLIHDRIIQLRKQYPARRLVVVGEDMLTSGAYFIAVAAETIYVNPSSLTGSIGVVARNFGFVEAMQKIGIERRTQTAGARKNQLDPFAPETPADREKLATILEGIHRNFIDAVKEGRGAKLKGAEAELFSGDFWLGTRAVELGLADGIGSLADVLQREFQVSRVREFRPPESWLTRALRSARSEVHALLDAAAPIALLPY
ncbi:MAG: S49 family peptidase [Burkholderiales bacterium]|nr:S49 family peptidase [Burkholderiales bacterium]